MKYSIPEKTGAKAPRVPLEFVGAISDTNTAWAFVPIPKIE